MKAILNIEGRSIHFDVELVSRLDGMVGPPLETAHEGLSLSLIGVSDGYAFYVLRSGEQEA